jgi:hypothetical protein
VLAGGRLANVELARNEQTANAIFYQVAVHLRRKVFCGVLKPLQDLQSPVVGKSADCNCRSHTIRQLTNYDITLIGATKLAQVNLVTDKRRPLGDAFVQSPSRSVKLLGLPVHEGNSSFPRGGDNRCDELPSHATLPGGWSNE